MYHSVRVGKKVKTHFHSANFTHGLATFQVISSLTRNFLKGARGPFRKNYLLKIGLQQTKSNKFKVEITFKLN